MTNAELKAAQDVIRDSRRVIKARKDLAESERALALSTAKLERVTKTIKPVTVSV